KENDGGAGGGFEPAPHGTTWMGQPHHRGSWYYACEIDLGYCGALRTAATVLADDAIFGRFCFGGDWRQTTDAIEIIPKDGVRRRIHAMLDTGRLHMVLETDRFAASTPIVLDHDLARVRFHLESGNSAAHTTVLRISGIAAGQYAVRNGHDASVATIEIADGQDAVIELPVGTSRESRSFSIAR
ncbi:MAG TPA: hypothetical protein VIQ74_13640, partial [Gemmatimonadaceae bacterium]